MPEPLYSRQQVMEFTGASPGELRAFLVFLQIPTVVAGGRDFIPESSLPAVRAAVELYNSAPSGMYRSGRPRRKKSSPAS